MLARLVSLLLFNTFVFFILPTSSYAIEAISISEKFSIYSKFSKADFENPDTENKALKIGEKYQELFADEVTDKKLRRANAENLRFLFRATNDVLFYTLDPSYVKNMVSVIEYLKLKKQVTEQQIETLYGVYISLRQFKEAADLATRFPLLSSKVLPELPEATNSIGTARSEWNINSEFAILEKKNVAYSLGALVVVTVHPQCHFSNNAIQSIIADPELSRVMLGSVKWLVPQGRKLDFEVIQGWNREHPKTIMTLANNKKEWPEITDWSTPNFYFFRDGILVSKITGWPREGNKKLLLESLNLIGL